MWFKAIGMLYLIMSLSRIYCVRIPKLAQHTFIDNPVHLSVAPGELAVVEHSVLDRRLLVHLVDVLVAESIAHRRQQLAEVILVECTYRQQNQLELGF